MATYPQSFVDSRGRLFHRVRGERRIYRLSTVPGLWRLDSPESVVPVPLDEKARREDEHPSGREADG